MIMAKIEQIQQEFEELIKELDRLKKINELISTNTENSKNVIHEMSSFVKISNDYRKKVDEDFKKKNEAINNLIKKIDISIDKFESDLEKFKNTSLEILNKNKIEGEKKIDKLKKELEQILENQSNILGEVKTNVLVLNQINENNTQKLNELITNSLPKSIESLKNSLLNRLDNYEIKNKKFRKIIYIMATVTLLGVAFCIMLWS